MSALQAQLDAAVDVDSLRFSGGEYADARFGAVKGRIARRRAARSAGIGGASLVGVGAVAFGAGQVPWSGFVLGANPGHSPSVVCTTSTPDAVVAATVPNDAVYAVVENATDEVIFIGWNADGSQAQAWNKNAKALHLEQVDGLAKYAFVTGTVITVHANDEYGDTVEISAGITVVPVRQYAEQAGIGALYAVEVGAVPGTGATWALTVNGDQLGLFSVTDEQTDFTWANGESVSFGRGDSGLEYLALPGGENLAFRFSEGAPVYVGQTAGHVTVTCDAGGVSPSESASAAPSPVTSAQPSATPDPSLSDSIANALSPFQCDAILPSVEFGSDQLRVFGAATTSSAIKAVLTEWYGEQPPATEVPNTDATAFHATVDFDVAGYSAGVMDPAAVVETDHAFGISFVAVHDRTVVGTIEPNADGSTYGMVEDRDGNAGPAEAFLWDRSAFTPCGSASLDDAEIYAVAGAKSGPQVDYSWIKVSD